tara:strand:- start:8763 stop:9668 length:906 start_codon:yes stop_codon:yes gene_type:complete
MENSKNFILSGRQMELANFLINNYDQQEKTCTIYIPELLENLRMSKKDLKNNTYNLQKKGILIKSSESNDSSRSDFRIFTINQDYISFHEKNKRDSNIEDSTGFFSSYNKNFELSGKQDQLVNILLNNIDNKGTSKINILESIDKLNTSRGNFRSILSKLRKKGIIIESSNSTGGSGLKYRFFTLSKDFIDYQKNKNNCDQKNGSIKEGKKVNIYAILDSEKNAVKIGHTSGNVNKRLDQLQTGNPSDLVLLGKIKDFSSQEYSIHKSLSSERLKGEWFIFNDFTKKVLENFCFFSHEDNL